jgi:hypothetical protein
VSSEQKEVAELLREAYRWAREAGREIAQLRARAQDDVNAGVLGFAAEHLDKSLKRIKEAGAKLKHSD